WMMSFTRVNPTPCGFLVRAAACKDRLCDRWPVRIALPSSAHERPDRTAYLERGFEHSEAGHGPAAEAARGRCLDVGEDRVRAVVRRRAGGLLRLPDLPDLRLVLRAAVGPGSAAPAPARLPCVSRTDRASAGDRLRDGLLDLR